jgi:cell division protein FtsZ
MSIGMSDEFQSFDQRAVIKVCGIGGGGGNAVGRMIEAGLSDVEFITINTDAQALKTSPAGTRLQIGVQLTGGLGSGATPTVGCKAAEEDRERVREVLNGADMVFLTVGLGGGTGTGASPIVAQEASASGALTVAIVTLPFNFEGRERMANAMKGLADLEQHVDTLIVVPNDRVAALCQSNMSLLSAFRQADEVLLNGVRAISELITVPGLVNLDFADVRTIMQARGRALMGIGVAEGEGRAVRAAEEAIVCPLLEQSTINGAMGVIVNIKAGCDVGMREVQEAVTVVKKAAHPDANIIFGAVVDENERPELQVTVIAAGFPREAAEEYLSRDPEEYSQPREYSWPMRKPAPAAKAAAAPAMAAPSPIVEEDLAEEPEPIEEPEMVPVGRVQPVEQYLFEEEEAVVPAEAADEAEEDLTLPAFIRRRMRKKTS